MCTGLCNNGKYYLVGTEAKADMDSECVGMATYGKGERKIRLAVGRLSRDSLPSVHTVHVMATSNTRLSRPLRASWTFLVVDSPLTLNIRSVHFFPHYNTHDTRSRNLNQKRLSMHVTKIVRFDWSAVFESFWYQKLALNRESCILFGASF